MSQNTIPSWKAMRTDDSQHVEEVVRQKFPTADAYRYNSATIRLRVIDEQFESLSQEKRFALVEPLLDTLPIETQRDIITVMLFAPIELQHSTRVQLMNLEFDEPSKSEL